MTHHKSNHGGIKLAVTLGVGLAGAAATMAALRRKGGADDAPGRTARGSGLGSHAVAGKTVTIDRPRADLFAYWRDATNLPRFMENIRSVEPLGDDRALWCVAMPGGDVEVETEIVEERPDELIAWRSVDGASIECNGKVRFHDAPAGRGTRVEATIAYHPVGGEAGRLVAKLFGRAPEFAAEHDLKRFKMLMEAGEIATSDRRPHHADADQEN